MSLSLLRPHYLTVKNRFIFRRRTGVGANRELLLGLIVLIIMFSIYTAVRMTFFAMQADPLFVQIVPGKIIEFTFHYFFILLIVSNSVAAMGNIYSADNMNLLLTAPISSFRLYRAKFLETGIETSIMFFVLTLPAALAFANALHLPGSFLAVAFLLSLVFLPIPVGIGVIIATASVRLVALLWRYGATLLAGFLITAALAVHQFGAHIVALKERNQAGGVALAEFINLFENPNPLWAPGRWVADLLEMYLGTSSELPQENLMLLAATVIGSFALGFLVFDLFSFRVRSQSGTNQKVSYDPLANRRRADIVRRVVRIVYGRFSLEPQMRAVIVKDLSSLVRDRALSLQLLFYLGVLAIYVTVFSFTRNAFGVTLSSTGLWAGTLASVHFIFTGLILTTIMTRLVYPSMSLEGRAVWILQVTPMSIEKLVWAKLICWLPLTTSLALILLLAGGVAIGLEAPATICFLVVGTALAFGYTGLAIGLGSAFATFDWESPNQISIGAGALSLLLLGVGLVFLLAIPNTVLTYFASVPRLRELVGMPAAFAIMVAALFLILFANMAVARTACRRGARTLEARKGQIV